jgi:hypothetical protein
MRAGGVWYLSRCGHVSMSIAGQTRGIRRPATAGNGANKAERTSVAIVMVGICARVVVEVGSGGMQVCERIQAGGVDQELGEWVEECFEAHEEASGCL